MLGRSFSRVSLHLSFVIPLFNCLPLSRACVQSLQGTLPSDLSHEIILVDDGSTDGTRDWLRTLHDPPFRVVLNAKNLGYAGANHRGVSVARGEFVALLNNDLVLTPHWFEPMLGAFHGREKIGLVGNVQLNARTGAIDHTGIFINAKGKPEHDHDLPLFARLKRVVALTGACVVIRRDTWHELGGFDEGFRNGGEDVDLCLRARRQGYRCVVATQSTIGHHISASPGRKRHDEANTRRLVERWGAELAELGLRAWNRAYLERVWGSPTSNPHLEAGCASLAYWLRLRQHAPNFVREGMQDSLKAELLRWEAILGPVVTDFSL